MSDRRKREGVTWFGSAGLNMNTVMGALRKGREDRTMTDQQPETQTKTLLDPSDRACRYCGCMKFEDHEYNRGKFIGRHFACGATVTPVSEKDLNFYTFHNGAHEHLELMLANRVRWAYEVLSARTWGYPLTKSESEKLDDQLRRLALQIRDAHGGHQ